MTLSHYPTGFLTELSDQRVTLIVVEDPMVMADYVYQIKGLIENDEGDFSLYDEDKEIKFSKNCEVIVDPWCLDFNSKRIKGKLFQLINDIVKDQFYEDFLMVNSELFSFTEKVMEHIQYNTVYNMDLDMNAFSKMLDIRIDQGENTVVERITEYMKLISSLSGIRVFFLVNIRTFISDYDMKMIYKEARYNGIFLVFIESVERTFLEDEQVFIIDKDKCIIEL